ncbi:hypothetical protein D920_01044 [Enterococcus faecalis 13-SD-W-01]|nr:hypothetical protein D920_01044 [Enterococcus faecalis 13-SD-W-01]
MFFYTINIARFRTIVNTKKRLFGDIVSLLFYFPEKNITQQV